MLLVKAAEFTNHFTYVMLLVAWFNWDKALSSTKFSIQETARDDYYQDGIECADEGQTEDLNFSINDQTNQD